MPQISQQELQRLQALRNAAPGRDAIADVQRLALFLPDGSDDQALLNRVADFLADARQAFRGGPKDQPAKNFNK